VKNTSKRLAVALALLAVAVPLAQAAKKKDAAPEPDPKSYFAGKEPKAAAEALLARGSVAAGGGSYEQIEIARVSYLSGKKEEGRAVLERYAQPGTKEKGDLYRIAKVYCEAKEWETARPLFDRVLAIDPEWQKALRTAGACAYWAGDRALAEDYFARAIRAKADDTWTYSAIAAVNAGIPPNLD
jgi:tetratricopeptide (TPR) repeat protein